MAATIPVTSVNPDDRGRTNTSSNFIAAEKQQSAKTVNTADANKSFESYRTETYPTGEQGVGSVANDFRNAAFKRTGNVILNFLPHGNGFMQHAFAPIGVETVDLINFTLTSTDETMKAMFADVRPGAVIQFDAIGDYGVPKAKTPDGTSTCVGVITAILDTRFALVSVGTGVVPIYSDETFTFGQNIYAGTDTLKASSTGEVNLGIFLGDGAVPVVGQPAAKVMLKLATGGGGGGLSRAWYTVIEAPARPAPTLENPNDLGRAYYTLRPVGQTYTAYDGGGTVPYTKDVSTVLYNGLVYICRQTHTSPAQAPTVGLPYWERHPETRVEKVLGYEDKDIRNFTPWFLAGDYVSAYAHPDSTNFSGKYILEHTLSYCGTQAEASVIWNEASSRVSAVFK